MYKRTPLLRYKNVGFRSTYGAMSDIYSYSCTYQKLYYFYNLEVWVHFQYTGNISLVDISNNAKLVGGMPNNVGSKHSSYYLPPYITLLKDINNCLQSLFSTYVAHSGTDISAADCVTKKNLWRVVLKGGSKDPPWFFFQISVQNPAILDTSNEFIC